MKFIAALLLMVTSFAQAQTFVQINNDNGTVGSTAWVYRNGNTITVVPSRTIGPDNSLVLPQSTAPTRPAIQGNFGGVAVYLMQPQTDYGRCLQSTTPNDYCDLAWLISNNYFTTGEYTYARSKGVSVAQIVFEVKQRYGITSMR